jgi:hypothetical protein
MKLRFEDMTYEGPISHFLIIFQFVLYVTRIIYVEYGLR